MTAPLLAQYIHAIRTSPRLSREAGVRNRDLALALLILWDQPMTAPSAADELVKTVASLVVVASAKR